MARANPILSDNLRLKECFLSLKKYIFYKYNRGVAYHGEEDQLTKLILGKK